MNTKFLIEKLQQYNIFSEKEYTKEAFSRNIGIFTEDEQKTLFKSKVAIPGMGGVGGAHFMTMVRTGVSRFNISDFDIYEPVNINRQFGARIPDFGRSKMAVMKEQALSVNPFIEINEFPEGINENNIDSFLDGVDVVLDSLDFFAFDTRRMLFNRSREKGIYVITAGPLGFSSAMLIFAPDKGMSFDEYFNIVKGMKPEEQYLAFAIGLAPRALQFKYMDTSKVNLKSRKGPSLNIGCQLCSAMAGTEAVRIILKRGVIKPVPYYFQFDPYMQKYCKGKLLMGNRNPLQRLKAHIVKYMLKKNEKLINLGRIQPEIPNIKREADGNIVISKEIIDYIIKAGIQAPSGDNAQPWSFSYRDNQITLYLDKNADQSFFNLNQIASVISCGAVIENITIAGTLFGLEAAIDYCFNSEDKRYNKIATINFSENSNLSKDSLADYIWKRETNRKLYKKETVSSSLIFKLRTSIQNIAGTEIHFITERAMLEQTAQIVSKADKIRTENRYLHEHLFSMIRFSLKEAMEKRDGFYIKNLEAGVAGELFLKSTKSWTAMKIANKLGLGKIVAQAAQKGIINSSGVALITTKGRTEEDFINGGRALERIWLTMTQAGYKIQPMTAITLFFLRKQFEGYVNFSNSQVQMLDKIWKDYKNLFLNADLDNKGMVMLFRFGKADNILYGTLRKSFNYRNI